MPLVSRLDSPEIYTAIRALRATYVQRHEIVRRLAADHGVTISVSGLDQWLRSRATGRRRKLRHQLPPLAAESEANPSSASPTQTQATNSRATLAHRLGL